ncbi:hypothetical protein CAEBREN_29771, partial [Caenorhabditis brenneri]
MTTELIETTTTLITTEVTSLTEISEASEEEESSEEEFSDFQELKHESKSKIECAKHGVSVIENDKVDNKTSTICTEGFCTYKVFVNQKKVDVLIPPEYTTHKHTVTWKKLFEGKFILIEKECPAQDYCSKLNKYFDCIICTSFILNSHCHLKYTILVFTFLLLIPLKLATTYFNRKKISLLLRSIFCRNSLRTTRNLPESIEMQPLQRNRRQLSIPRGTRTINLVRSVAERIMPNRNTPRNQQNQNTENTPRPTSLLPTPRKRTFEIETTVEDGREVTRVIKTSSRTPSPPIITLATIITLFAIIVTATADVCDKTVPISHEEELCDDQNNCRLERTEDIYFTPQSRTACLQLHTKQKVLLKFKLSIDHLFRTCRKGPILYTKNVTIHSDSAKRCHGMGECVDRKCLDVGPQSKLIEFPEGNKYPGKTYCERSCGTLWCRCLLPTPGCLFYRNYAIPTNDDLFEMYTCESWTERVKMSTSITVNNQKTKDSFLLGLGDEKRLKYDDDNTKITVRLLEIGETTGLSVLGKKFIQKGEKIALVQTVDEIYPLECDETGSCQYRETCQCRNAEDTAICDCREPDLYKILDNKRDNLPIITERYHLSTTPDNTPAIKMRHNTLHIQISLENIYHTSAAESKIDCSIKDVTTFKGCYNCLKGATQNITCTSKQETHAKLTCGDDHFIDLLTCDKKGIVNEIHRQFNESKITGKCQVLCGSKNNSVTVEGKLDYVSHPSLLEYLNKVMKSETKITDIHPNLIPDVGGFLDNIYTGLMEIILGLICFTVIAAIIYLCCIPCCISLIKPRG